MDVTWHGLTALYTDEETGELKSLPAREQLVFHMLKYHFEGTVSASHRDGHLPKREPDDRPGLLGSLPEVFIDPEDIPFGPDIPTLSLLGQGPGRLKPSQSIVELSWTWNKHRVCKTKKAANHHMRVWKRWYERHGWTVRRSGEDFVALKDGRREAITLRVYAKPKESLF
jgi:hypothetical protein